MATQGGARYWGIPTQGISGYPIDLMHAVTPGATAPYLNPRQGYDPIPVLGHDRNLRQAPAQSVPGRHWSQFAVLRRFKSQLGPPPFSQNSQVRTFQPEASIDSCHQTTSLARRCGFFSPSSLIFISGGLYLPSFAFLAHLFSHHPTPARISTKELLLLA